MKAYTVADPFHSSSYYILKRKAFCNGCLHNDDFLKDGCEIAKGEKVIKVTSGAARSTRTQHFHIECYVSHCNHVMTAFTNSVWKVYPNNKLVIKATQEQQEQWALDAIPF